MLYYYFGSKERLFVAVLERAYATIRAAEQTIEVDHLDPAAAIRRLAELTFDHHESHPDFIRLVSIENIHRAEHIAGHRDLAGQNTPAIELIEKILERGRRDGSFTREIDAVDLHMMISAFCVFRIANRHTFGAIFDRDLTEPRAATATGGCSATWSSSTCAATRSGLLTRRRSSPAPAGPGRPSPRARAARAPPAATAGRRSRLWDRRAGTCET